jgi:hypothetical protein
MFTSRLIGEFSRKKRVLVDPQGEVQQAASSLLHLRCTGLSFAGIFNLFQERAAFSPRYGAAVPVFAPYRGLFSSFSVYITA